jgi:hypothetical protein
MIEMELARCAEFVDWFPMHIKGVIVKVFINDELNEFSKSWTVIKTRISNLIISEF